MDRIQHYEKQDLLRLVTRDGFVVTALLITDSNGTKKEKRKAPILLQIHGLLGHFLAHGTPRMLPHALCKKGFDSLSINTRLATAGQILGRGIFDDTIHDIDVAVEFLEQEGFGNIFILGYSLGADMLLNWLTNRPHGNIRGILFEGPHYSFPNSCEKKYTKWGSNPGYEEICDRAGELLGDDPYNSENDETFVIYQSRGPDRKPGSSEIFTYKTWWFMAGPKAHRVMAHKHIEKVKVPILFLRGESDFIVEAWEPEALAELARKAGNTQVRVRSIPHARHDCMENPEQMIKKITSLFREYSTQ